MIIKHRWCKNFDRWSKRTFIVVPLTGHLLVRDGRLSDEEVLSASSLLGMTKASLDPEGFTFPLDAIDVEQAPDDLPDYTQMGHQISRVVSMANRILPLRLSVILIELMYGKRMRPKLRLEDSIGLVSAMFGRRSKQDCLEMSLKRYALLRYIGHKPNINVGVFIPTEEMHAWVSIDNLPILECPDVLMHYTQALIYSPCESRVYSEDCVQVA